MPPVFRAHALSNRPARPWSGTLQAFAQGRTDPATAPGPLRHQSRAPRKTTNTLASLHERAHMSRAYMRVRARLCVRESGRLDQDILVAQRLEVFGGRAGIGDQAANAVDEGDSHEGDLAELGVIGKHRHLARRGHEELVAM